MIDKVCWPYDNALYKPVWSKPYGMFMPCIKIAAELGQEWEVACAALEIIKANIAHHGANEENMRIFYELVDVESRAREALRPYENQYFSVREGYSLN